MTRRITIRDLEKAMGQPAAEVGPFCFDPETMSWSRTITFKLDKKKRPKKARKPSPPLSAEER